METIYKKIQNLLNMTVGNGCSESEAANAASLAQKLLLQNGLEEADVRALQAEGTKEVEIIEEVAQTQAWHTGQFEWQVGLAQRVAKNCSCALLVSKRTGLNASYFWFVGTPSAVKVAKLLFTWLSEQIYIVAEQERKSVYRTRQAAGLPHYVGRGYFKSLMLGITHRVCDRLAREFSEQVREANAGKYVLATVNEAQKRADEISSGKTVKTEQSKLNSAGFLQGIKAGDRVKTTREESLPGGGSK